MNRMAGALLASALGGSGAALAANALVNTPMDQLVDQYNSADAGREAMGADAYGLYEKVMGVKMSTKDFATAIQALEGSLDVNAPVSVETPGGKKAITAALQVQQQDPALGQAMAAQAKKDLALFSQAKQQGVGGDELATAAAYGGGTTPIPGIAAGLAGGALGYGAGHMLGGLRRPAAV